MKQKTQRHSIAALMKNVVNNDSIMQADDSALVLYDLDFLARRIDEIKHWFPGSCNHAIACKANPLVEILKRFEKWGTGLETASLPELYIAEKCGFRADKIVFDSPAKTVEELRYALKLGVHINADSFSELERIESLYKSCHSSSVIGLRINPQVGAGSIKSTSVADKISKFGVGLAENKQKIIRCYEQYSWLTGIHVHIGSQGISQQKLIQGLGKVYHLTKEINHTLNTNKIKYFDMGGGFPVSYHSDTKPLSMKAYVQAVKDEFPKLFTADYHLTTEFGRYISANAACAVSRIESVKHEADSTIMIVHFGADFMLREAYNSQDWSHEFSVFDCHGKPKTATKTKTYKIAGPLCFAGDFIASDIQLPEVFAGDYLLVHDVGAYTMSMWSRYNSRQRPKVVGYSNKGSNFTTLRKRETLHDLYKFWK